MGPKNVTTDRNIPYRDKACVAEMSKKRVKGGSSEILHNRDPILGLINDSLVADTALERLISSINVKEEAPRRINNGKAKANMAHRKGAVSKVVSNSMHSMVTSENLARTLNVGLHKADKMFRNTTQCGIRTAVHPISRKYRINHLDLCRKYTSGIWCMDWMTSATKSITQCKGAFVSFNRTLPEVYPKESNKIMQAAETLRELCEDVGILENLKSDRAPELYGKESSYINLCQVQANQSNLCRARALQ